MLLAPAFIVLVVLLWTGLGIAFVRASGVYPAFGMVTPSGIFWREVLGDEAFGPSLWLTLRIAGLSTLAAAGLGTALAFLAAAWTKPTWRLRLLLQCPLYLPHLVAANVVILTLGQSGLFARILHLVGLAAEPADAPRLVYDAFGWGSVLGFALKETPFVAVLVYPFALAALATYGPVARTLGASLGGILRRIVLPMSWPAVATAAVITFAYGFSSFEIPSVLGRTYPKVLSNWAYELYTNVEAASRPRAMVVGLLVVGGNAVLAGVYFVLAARYDAMLTAIRAGKTT